MHYTFYLTAAVAIVSTAMVIFHKNAVHALLYLVTSLLSVAVIFYQFGAPLAAALEVIIYAGAIMVLVIFVIMMLNQGGCGGCTGTSLVAAPHLDRAGAALGHTAYPVASTD
uniref:NADH-quinone oxidoreductase subunit J n=1 Tax=gamma proteobacterium D250 TaxID=649546 RepID=M4HWQ3_9GAMM|nr:NADH dehydrogenase I chain J-like protein [gamma proteobacterium D250]